MKTTLRLCSALLCFRVYSEHNHARVHACGSYVLLTALTTLASLLKQKAPR